MIPLLFSFFFLTRHALVLSGSSSHLTNPLTYIIGLRGVPPDLPNLLNQS